MYDCSLDDQCHENIELIQDELIKGFREVREQLNNQNGSCLQYRRFNTIIDRRDFYKNNGNHNDKLIIFEPPSDCNTIPHQHLAEKYFDLSRMCLIPRSGY